jgi:hypothetical protein
LEDVGVLLDGLTKFSVSKSGDRGLVNMLYLQDLESIDGTLAILHDIAKVVCHQLDTADEAFAVELAIEHVSVPHPLPQ